MSEEYSEPENYLDIPDAEASRREQERRRREEEEIQHWIKERCALAVEQWKAAHPWVDDPGMCVSVPVPRKQYPFRWE
jgi:hypothetical protein